MDSFCTWMQHVFNMSNNIKSISKSNAVGLWILQVASRGTSHCKSYVGPARLHRTINVAINPTPMILLNSKERRDLLIT